MAEVHAVLPITLIAYKIQDHEYDMTKAKKKKSMKICTNLTDKAWWKTTAII